MSDWALVFAAIAAAAAVIAAGEALAGLIVAAKTLGEARSTSQLQAKTVSATNAVAELQAKTVVATNAVVDRIQASLVSLDRILVEAEVTREIDQLQRIANQVGDVIVLRHRVVRDEPLSRNQLTDAKELLAAYLAAVRETLLPNCRLLAETSDARIHHTQLEEDAKREVRDGIATARARLARSDRLTE